MLRRGLMGLLGLALVAAPLPLAVTFAGSAAAGTGDVLTVERFNASSSGARTTTAAAFNAYGPASSTAPAGAQFRFDYTAEVTLAPPSGTRFVAGQTYAAGTTATATRAMLGLSFTFFAASGCPDSVNGVTFTGSVTVLAASYDDSGVLTELAADYRATCSPGYGLAERVGGSVRHGSGVPWLSVGTAYQSDVVALGRRRSQDVTLTGTGAGGKAVTLGAASLSGRRAADYTVTDDRCAGVRLGNGDTCHVSVTFEPLPLRDNEPTDRVAALTVPADGHVDAVTVRLDSSKTDLPTTPTALSTFPTATGLGLGWHGSDNGAQQYDVSRRTSGDDAWTSVATVHEGGTLGYVDRDAQPGQQVSYRVTPSNSGWAGTPATTTGTRPTDLPSPTATRLLSLDFRGDPVSGDQGVVIRGSDDGSSIDAYGGQSPGLTAVHDSGDGHEERVQFAVPLVAGPGTYHAAGLTGGPSPFNSRSCTFQHQVLVVRHVLYDESRKPLLLDASWTGVCDDAAVVHLEIRYGSDAGDAKLATTPVQVGRLTTYGGRSVVGSVTVTNAGPSAVALTGASLAVSADGDWQVAQDGCAALTLAPAAHCVVGVRFTSTAVGTRPGLLEVAQHNADGELAPAQVPLSGFAATVPDAPIGRAEGTIGAVLLGWRVSEDGGLPVQSFDVERRAPETTVWTHVATVPVSAHPSWVDRDVAYGAGGYDYRVRAANEVGAGAWQTIGFTGAAPGPRAVVVSGRPGGTGPRGLWQLTLDSLDTPVIPLTDDPAHDYRDPAVAPGATRLAVSVSTGDGSDGQYDLWTGTLAHPATTRLTDAPGAERDAAYSPDASTIAFTQVSTGGHRAVWTVPSSGGTPRLLRDDAARPAWTGDGSGLVVEDDTAASSPLLVLDPTTGVASRTLPDSDGGSQPTVAPDGTIAWVDPDGSVSLLPPGAGTAERGTPSSDRRAANPSYTDTGRLLYDLVRNDTGASDPLLTQLVQGVVETAPALLDHYAPDLTISSPSGVVRGAATYSVTTSDDLTPGRYLNPRCRLDGQAWGPCSGTLSALAEGRHTIEAAVTDVAGNTATRSLDLVSDTRAPVLTASAPTVAQAMGGSPVFRWSATDTGSGGLTYDVTVSTATPTTGFTAYRRPAGWSASDPRTALVVRPRLGQETCVRVRARDASGLWSGLLTRCVARPLDDTALRVSAGWRRTRAAGHYASTETVVARPNAAISTPTRVTVRRIGILATTCSTCGTVRVYVGARYVGAVSLVSARTANRQLRYVPLLRAATTGQVAVRTATRRTVRVDGLLLGRS